MENGVEGIILEFFGERLGGQSRLLLITAAVVMSYVEMMNGFDLIDASCFHDQ